jgi:plastocyanin
MRIRSRTPLAVVAALIVLALPGAATASSATAGEDVQAQPAPGEEVIVIARDYLFEGLPVSVPAGTTFGFVNEGEEAHEILLARRNDGVTETWPELLALPDEEALGLVTLVAALVALPGETAEGSMTVAEEGEYLAICMIPQFTRTGPLVFPPFHPLAETVEPGAEAPGSAVEPPAESPLGPPHAMLGQLQVFTVTAPGTPVGPLPEPVS